VLNLSSAIIDGNLSCYIREVNAIPVLSYEQENEFAMLLYKDGDVSAAHALVTSHLRLVVKIAMKFSGYGLPMLDVISEGNLGLMKAVKKFNPNLGYRLATYAMWWIRSSIQDYILKSWSKLKVGASAMQKKLFFNLSKAKQKLGDNAYEDGELVRELGVSKENIENFERSIDVMDLDSASSSNDDATSIISNIPDDSAVNPEEFVIAKQDEEDIKARISKVLSYLNAREQSIIQSRFLIDNPKTLEELSGLHGISKERVRQIIVRAMEKMRVSLES
ncbi:MAG: RNA polymerase factor sigma-32, partial [Proteobacteria bacterium]|nr:RNA polymerase factor sigma-32 [Pseudomonadota bacterium]